MTPLYLRGKLPRQHMSLYVTFHIFYLIRQYTSLFTFFYLTSIYLTFHIFYLIRQYTSLFTFFYLTSIYLTFHIFLFDVNIPHFSYFLFDVNIPHFSHFYLASIYLIYVSFLTSMYLILFLILFI